MAVVAMANAKTAKQMVVCGPAGGKIMTNVVIYWKWLRGKYLAITHLVQTNWAQRRKFPVTFFCQKYCPTFCVKITFLFSALSRKKVVQPFLNRSLLSTGHSSLISSMKPKKKRQLWFEWVLLEKSYDKLKLKQHRGLNFQNNRQIFTQMIFFPTKINELLIQLK